MAAAQEGSPSAAAEPPPGSSIVQVVDAADVRADALRALVDEEAARIASRYAPAELHFVDPQAAAAASTAEKLNKQQLAAQRYQEWRQRKAEAARAVSAQQAAEAKAKADRARELREKSTKAFREWIRDAKQRYGFAKGSAGPPAHDARLDSYAHAASVSTSVLQSSQALGDSRVSARHAQPNAGDVSADNVPQSPRRRQMPAPLDASAADHTQESTLNVGPGSGQVLAARSPQTVRSAAGRGYADASRASFLAEGDSDVLRATEEFMRVQRFSGSLAQKPPPHQRPVSAQRSVGSVEQRRGRGSAVPGQGSKAKRAKSASASAYPHRQPWVGNEYSSQDQAADEGARGSGALRANPLHQALSAASTVQENSEASDALAAMAGAPPSAADFDSSRDYGRALLEAKGARGTALDGTRPAFVIRKPVGQATTSPTSASRHTAPTRPSLLVAVPPRPTLPVAVPTRHSIASALSGNENRKAIITERAASLSNSRPASHQSSYPLSKAPARAAQHHHSVAPPPLAASSSSVRASQHRPATASLRSRDSVSAARNRGSARQDAGLSRPRSSAAQRPSTAAAPARAPPRGQSSHAPHSAVRPSSASAGLRGLQQRHAVAQPPRVEGGLGNRSAESDIFIPGGAGNGTSNAHPLGATLWQGSRGGLAADPHLGARAHPAEKGPRPSTFPGATSERVRAEVAATMADMEEVRRRRAALAGYP